MVRVYGLDETLAQLTISRVDHNLATTSQMQLAAATGSGDLDSAAPCSARVAGGLQATFGLPSTSTSSFVKVPQSSFVKVPKSSLGHPLDREAARLATNGSSSVKVLPEAQPIKTSLGPGPGPGPGPSPGPGPNTYQMPPDVAARLNSVDQLHGQLKVLPCVPWLSPLPAARPAQGPAQ